MKYLSIIFAVFLTFSAQAQETEITVMGVTLPGGDPAQALNQMLYLSANWPASETGITINLVNGGVAPQITSLLTGHWLTELGAGKQTVSSLRDESLADIVIFFTGVIDVCGAGPQKYWAPDNGSGGSFIGDVNGHDLRAKNESWGAIVSTQPACAMNNHAALHELGHLLGAGHTDRPGEYLYSDSHAFWVDTGFFAIRTLMVEGGKTGQLSSTFSTYTGTTNNIRAVIKTAPSVAQYRVPTPPPPPQCGLVRPQEVEGTITGICNPPPWTTHSVTWEDTCPSATEFYQVWFSQPTSNGYEYGWSVTTNATSVAVKGATALIKVKACDYFSCSELSLDYYVASTQCNGGDDPPR